MDVSVSSLVGAATTEDEGFELALRTQSDLLICSSDVESGYGINLLRRVKAELLQQVRRIAASTPQPDLPPLVEELSF